MSLVLVEGMLGISADASAQNVSVLNFSAVAPKPRKRLFIPNPFCVRPPPAMRTVGPGEILVCYPDRFPVGPTRRSFAADPASVKAHFA